MNLRILGIDTSSLACSAAVTENGKLLGEKIMNSGLTHSETLMPAVEAILDGMNLTPADIDLFAVAAGPGSFTGVRIGVCAVKALCAGTDKPCARVDTLHALAMGSGFDGLICPILDARREQVYTALFRGNGESAERVMEDKAIPLTELIASLPNEKVYFTGDGLDTYEDTIREKMGNRAVIAPGHMRALRASCVCRAAELCDDTHMSGMELTPLYLRLSQAERERSERLTRAKL